jgi:rhodanese-related sulfurtransferase
MARMNLRTLIAVSLLSAPLLAPAQEPPAAEVDATQLKGWLGAGRKLTLVDARSEQEYLEGHIPGALGIPAEQTKEQAWRLPSDKTVPVVYYCRGPG